MPRPVPGHHSRAVHTHHTASPFKQKPHPRKLDNYQQMERIRQKHLERQAAQVEYQLNALPPERIAANKQADMLALSIALYALFGFAVGTRSLMLA